MFSRFDLWQYREDNNCWDFVREWLIENGVPAEDVPKYGIHPDNKLEMHSAHKNVKRTFVECRPRHGAVACHYVGKILYHVGVIDGDMVRHTGKTIGTRLDSINAFEALAPTTKYFIHKIWLS